MQISCPNCRKTFFVKDELIPPEGRKLQCGKCFDQWFFSKPSDKKSGEIKKRTNEQNIGHAKTTDVDDDVHINKNKIKEFNFKDNKKVKEINIKKNNINIFKLILVIIITVIAALIVIETFKNQISIFFPDILVILDNLSETLHDIRLFIKDLFNL